MSTNNASKERPHVRAPAMEAALPRDVPLNRFVNITEAMVGEVLEPMGFKRTELPGTGEITFGKVIEFEGVETIVRVYTGIIRETGQSRPAGKDAIRVCLGRYDHATKRVRIFKTLETVRRIGTWARHLRERIEGIGTGLVPPKPRGLTEIDLLAGRDAPARPPNREDLRCPKCGAAMVGPKPNRNGHAFYGCSRFPACNGAINGA